MPCRRGGMALIAGVLILSASDPPVALNRMVPLRHDVFACLRIGICGTGLTIP
jgi:hypothetical protein